MEATISTRLCRSDRNSVQIANSLITSYCRKKSIFFHCYRMHDTFTRKIFTIVKQIIENFFAHRLFSVIFNLSDTAIVEDRPKINSKFDFFLEYYQVSNRASLKRYPIYTTFYKYIPKIDTDKFSRNTIIYTYQRCIANCFSDFHSIKNHIITHNVSIEQNIPHSFFYCRICTKSLFLSTNITAQIRIGYTISQHSYHGSFKDIGILSTQLIQCFNSGYFGSRLSTDQVLNCDFEPFTLTGPFGSIGLLDLSVRLFNLSVRLPPRVKCTTPREPERNNRQRATQGERHIPDCLGIGDRRRRTITGQPKPVPRHSNALPHPVQRVRHQRHQPAHQQDQQDASRHRPGDRPERADGRRGTHPDRGRLVLPRCARNAASVQLIAHPRIVTASTRTFNHSVQDRVA